MALKSGTLAFLFLLPAVFEHALAAQTGNLVSTPVLLWGTQEFFGKARTSVNYETAELADVWNGLIESRLGGNQQSSNIFVSSKTPQIFVVFAGTQISPRDLTTLDSTPTLKPLGDSLAASPSSLLLPNVNYKGDRADFIRLVGENKAVDVEVAGSCDEDVNAGNVQEVLDKAVSNANSTPDGKPQVVVVCSPESLEDEMTDLGRVSKTLKELSGSYAMMYVSYDNAGKEGTEDISSQRRRLLADEIKIDYTFCDEVCMTQVKFLEGIILSLVLVLALSAGLCCSHILDGPSQFEKPTEEMS